jgi:hypothetical protein
VSSFARLWAALSPLAIGGVVGFAVTAIDGCTARSDDEPNFGYCNCDPPESATYVLEAGHEGAPEDFPQLVGALFIVNDYEWREPYDADAPNAILRYLDGDTEVTVEFSYEIPQNPVDPDMISGSSGGQGGFGGGS